MFCHSKQNGVRGKVTGFGSAFSYSWSSLPLPFSPPSLSSSIRPPARVQDFIIIIEIISSYHIPSLNLQILGSDLVDSSISKGMFIIVTLRISIMLSSMNVIRSATVSCSRYCLAMSYLYIALHLSDGQAGHYHFVTTTSQLLACCSPFQTNRR